MTLYSIHCVYSKYLLKSDQLKSECAGCISLSLSVLVLSA